MAKIEDLQDKVMAFVNEREWNTKYSAKNLAIDIAIESSELLEIFQWMSDEESTKAARGTKLAKVEEELADVLWTTLVFGKIMNINFEEIINKKLALTAQRYPIEKSKGNHLKHTEL